jgi:hypothetical protein
VLEVCAALSAVNKIVTEDMIPAVIGDVIFSFLLLLRRVSLSLKLSLALFEGKKYLFLFYSFPIFHFLFYLFSFFC